MSEVVKGGSRVGPALRLRFHLGKGGDVAVSRRLRFRLRSGRRK